MMHKLVMPLPLAGFQIETDQALARQIVARPVASVVVRRGRLDRQIDQAQIFVHSDLVPDASVAVLGPGSLLPGLVAELARPGDSVELPNLFPCPHIERPNQTFSVVMAFNGSAFSERGTHDHHVSSYSRRRMDADLASFQIDLLVDSFHDTDLHVENAVRAKRVDQCARLGIELHEAITRRYVDDALVAFAVSPVRHTTPR